MTYIFYAIAALMILAALTFVLLPLLRRGRQSGRPRGVFVLSLVLAFALPVIAVGLYALVGTPVAINQAVREQPKITVDQAITQLKQHLKASPKDLQGWLLLGQSYTVMQDPAHARDAYGHALKLAPDNADIMVALAEADSLARPDHRIEGKSRSLLEKAVQTDPSNQRGLWLLGISDYQHEHFADAALLWRRLQSLLNPTGKVAAAVEHQIAMANLRSSGKTEAEATAMLQGDPAVASSATAVAVSHGPHLQIKVSLAPALRKQIVAGSTLFVYARAVDGAPMPLAVTRLKASELPTRVTLTDGMGMTPQFNLSTAKTVTVTARISKSGQATAQKGDLEGSASPVDVQSQTPIAIIIDHTR